MNTATEENGALSPKEQLIAELRQIVSHEKFEMDAYFMCGFPSKAPDEKLLKACEAYLAAVDQAQPAEAAGGALIAALEAAEAKPVTVDNLATGKDVIRGILARRALLLR